MTSKVSITCGRSSASIAASDRLASSSSSSSSSRPRVSPPTLVMSSSSRLAGRRAFSSARGLRLLLLGARDDRRLLGLGAGIGRLEIDDLAQQDLRFVELVAPDDDGLEGQRAFAKPGDHRLAAGLDALGDGDFALARQKLDRAHLAQIHAHRDRRCGRSAPSWRWSRQRPCRSARQARWRLPRRRPAVGSASASSPFSSSSTTLMPMSESMDMVSSICSEVTSSEGSTEFSSSMVT